MYLTFLGIIKTLKHYYRKKVVLHMLANAKDPKMKKINLLSASRFLKAAWEEVGPVTIQNCFAKAGFLCSLEPDVELIEPPQQWSQISHGISYEDFLNIDQNVPTFGGMTAEEIVSQIQNKKICESSDNESDEEDVEEKLPTCQEANDFFQNTIKFIEAQQGVPDDIFAAAHKLEKFLLNCQLQKKKQAKITDFA